MKNFINTANFLLICFVVYFGYRKSNKFFKEYNKTPDEMKEIFLKDIIKRKGPLGFWEGGAVTKLPNGLAWIGNFLAITVLVVILAMMTGLFVAWCRGGH